MTVHLNFEEARRVLFEVAELVAGREEVPVEWERIFEEISDECDASNSRTHIAFLGTALLARSVNADVDTYARKVAAGTPGAYDARSLAHKVLVPAAQELDIHLGVTGREPLNNQPYFRISRVTEEELLPIVRAVGTAKRVLHILDLIDKLDRAGTRAALAAFIKVRRARHTDYPTGSTHVAGTEVSRLVRAASGLEITGSGGRNAQAVVAGILDAALGTEYDVHCGRINDPDRQFVGDVCIAEKGTPSNDFVQLAAFEVREKIVQPSDVVAFQKRCAENNIGRAAIVAIGRQKRMNHPGIPYLWGEQRGVNAVVYQDWDEFVRQVIFWSRLTADEVVERAYVRVREYLVAIEAAPASVVTWNKAFECDARVLG